MTTATLNDHALFALRMMLTKRSAMYSDPKAADAAREDVRSYAVEVVNEILRANPELREAQP